MVNMIGFHHKEPEYNTAGFGQPGFYMHMRAKPTEQFPLRAVLRFPCGRATFYSVEHAREFLHHPGDVKHAAAHYLDSLLGGTSNARVACMDEEGAEDE
jgi:hypothetical protein